MILRGDALDEMHKMPDGAFKTVITSPPYNVCRDAADTGRVAAPAAGSSYRALHPGYDGYDDAMPHADYVAWQTECLREMWRLIREDGAIYYNHRFRHRLGPMDDLRWIHDAVPVRQIIVWDRVKSFNTQTMYYSTSYENIYLICKPKWRRHVSHYTWHGDERTPRARVKDTTRAPATSVWRFGPEANVPEHPAAFPVELPRRCLALSLIPI